MKKILLSIIPLVLQSEANSQITKGNWMEGGNASFVFSKASSGGSDSRSRNLGLAPNIGYFFMDNLVGGVRASFNSDHIRFGPSSNFTTFKNYSVGPFVRYYLLETDWQYNVLLEVNYQFGHSKTETTNSMSTSSTNLVSFFAGPDIYFNSCVGIEFLLNYSSTGKVGIHGRGNSFGPGLQIHLER